MAPESNLKLDSEINKEVTNTALNKTPPMHYINDYKLINEIFPLGLNMSDECFARAVASKIGYHVLYNLDLGEIAEVDINLIRPCQSILSKTKLIELMLYIRDNEVPGYPVGIKIGEKIYLLDGHHRASAQIIMGKKTIMMHLITLQEDDEIVQNVRNPKPIDTHLDKNNFDKQDVKHTCSI